MSKFIIKNPEEFLKDYGKNPKNRSFEELFDKGFIVVDKDSGPTSHQSADFLKNILNLSKAGHSGTLDPNVTGVLVIGLGRATRLMEYMLKSNKEYVCLMYLHKEINENEIKKVFKKFTGEIDQLPPIISAVKRAWRTRTIYSNKILQIKGKYVLFRTSCQHGTYIRKLCSDIGLSLGVGAQMIELKRTKAGPFTQNDNMIGLDKLRNLYELFNESKKNSEKLIYEKELRKYIRPMEDLLVYFKKVYIRDSAIDTISHGYNLALPGVAKFEEGIKKGEEVAIFSQIGELIAMGTSQLNSNDAKENKNGEFIKVEKVFIDIGYYPKFSWFLENTKLKNN